MGQQWLRRPFGAGAMDPDVALQPLPSERMEAHDFNARQFTGERYGGMHSTRFTQPANQAAVAAPLANKSIVTQRIHDADLRSGVRNALMENSVQSWNRPFVFFAHLITLSARANTFGGIVRPICFAVFRLITSSNFVGCSTGMSAGFAPLRILSIWLAARRYKSG
jgi:hypothetical protein